MASSKDGHLLIIRIHSALYGPSEGKRLESGELVRSNNQEEESLPFTRNVTKFVRDLLQQGETTTGETTTKTKTATCEAGIAVSAFQDGMKRSTIPLSIQSMNAHFGDPSPGISKALRIRYSVTSGNDTEIHEERFAEHEQVILRRYPKIIAVDDEIIVMNNDTITPRLNLTTSVSELVIPMVMPFLEVRQRVQCQLVCKIWKQLIHGVARTVDCQDTAFVRFTQRTLQGLLSHSIDSLEYLFLSGMSSLDPQVLSNCLPHFRKLRALDLSHCHLVDDNLLSLLAKHGTTLRVLYLKGLRKVTDQGLVALATQCLNLQVLDLSNVTAITDQGMIAVGQHLTKLRALFLRDNFRLTNASIDLVVRNCHELEQLTFWGLIRLESLEKVRLKSSCVVLNLWGCYGLTDGAAESVADMVNLRSLVVGECHRLTDKFVVRYCYPYY